MTDGNIMAAKVKLKRAVDRLIEKRPVIHYEVTVYQPSLYSCLISDLGGGQGDDHSPAKSQPPIWVDAMQLAVDIENRVKQWFPKPGTIPDRLQALSWHSWRPQDTDKVTDMARNVEGWCESILNLIDPENRKFIEAACPSCSKCKVHRRDSAGEMVLQPALKWTPAAGFQCQACKASWRPEQTLFFSRLLGFELPEGVLEG